MRLKWVSAVGVLLLAISCGSDPETTKRRAVAAGDAFVAQKKFPEAVIEYRKAVAADPRFGEARLKLASSYEEVGDTGNALREYVRAADLLPKDATAQIRAGQVLLVTRQYPEAKARALAALGADPTNTDGFILLGNSLAGLKDYKGAIEQIEEAIDQEPQRTLLYTNLGLIQMASGERAAAESAFKRATEASPKSAEAHASLANYYWATGRLAEAESELKVAYDLDRKSTPILLALAGFYIRNGRATEGETYLKEYTAASQDPGARMILADFYVAQRRMSEARPIYEALSKERGPRATDAILRIAGIDYQSGAKDKAHAAVDQLILADPKNEQVLLAKSRLLTADGKRADALAMVNRAVQANPKSLAALFGKSQLEETASDFDGAIATLQEFNKLNPGNYVALIRLGALYVAKGDTKGANDFVAEALKLRPGSGPANLLRARILISDGKTQESETILNALLRTNSETSEVHRVMGTLYLQRNDLVRARTSFDRALVLAPDSSEAIAGLIQIDLAQRKPEAARQRIEARLARGGSPDAAFWTVAGTTYVANGDAKQAESAFRKAIEVDPGNLESYGSLATLYMMTNRVSEAKAEYERLATSGRPATAVLAKTVLGSILTVEQKPEEARKFYQQALELDPRAGVAANNLAWSYAKDGADLDLALKYAQMAKVALPKSWEISDTLGWVYYQKKLASLAIASFEQGIQQNPSNPVIHYHLGLAYVQAEKDREARQAFERALKLDAKFDGADDARKQLARIKG